MCIFASKSEFDKKHDLFVNPLALYREQQIYYLNDGEIVSDDERINYDLNVILNLNERNLKKDRAKLYRQIKKKIKSFWARPQTRKAALQQLKTEWEKPYNNKFRSLCRIPLYLIEKELAKK